MAKRSRSAEGEATAKSGEEHAHFQVETRIKEKVAEQSGDYALLAAVMGELVKGDLISMSAAAEFLALRGAERTHRNMIEFMHGTSDPKLLREITLKMLENADKAGNEDDGDDEDDED